MIVPYSHVQHKSSTHPDKRAADPIIGLETGSARLFDTYMKGKAYPYRSHQWRDVVVKGMEILNRHNLFPMCTLSSACLAKPTKIRSNLSICFMICAMPRVHLCRLFVPLEDTRMQKKDSAKLIEMTDLQWEFFFNCWRYNLNSGRVAVA